MSESPHRYPPTSVEPGARRVSVADTRCWPDLPHLRAARAGAAARARRCDPHRARAGGQQLRRHRVHARTGRASTRGSSAWSDGCRCCCPMWPPASSSGSGRTRYFRGIRHLIHNEADPKWLLHDRMIEGLKLLAAQGLTFDVVATLPEHMECIPVIGERVPGLKMVIDHLGQPPIATRGLGRWGNDLKIAAENPNVYAKISGLGHRQRQLGRLDCRRHPPLRRIRHRNIRPGPLHARRRLAGLGAGWRLRQSLDRVPGDPGELSGGCAGGCFQQDGDALLRRQPGLSRKSTVGSRWIDVERDA